MTDNEIIKALTEWSERGMTFCNVGMSEFARHTLALINRQKEEIEELQAEIDKQYEQAKADILGNMSDGGTSCHWCIEQHKAEAVKEFAEKLENELGQLFLVNHKCVVDAIDNLVKEMVGEG